MKSGAVHAHASWCMCTYAKDDVDYSKLSAVCTHFSFIYVIAYENILEEVLSRIGDAMIMYVQIMNKCQTKPDKHKTKNLMSSKAHDTQSICVSGTKIRMGIRS